jgi:HlyD family secretion protein
MKLKTMVISGILLATVVGITGYAVVNSNREVPVSVRSAEVAYGDVSSYLLSSGSIRSKFEKQYYGSNLLIREVFVKVGDRVVAGDRLLEFDTRDLQAAVSQAELQRDNAVLQKNQTVTAAANAKESKKTIDNQLAAAKKQLATSTAKLEAALKDPLNIENISIIAKETQTLSGLESTISALTQARAQIPTVSSTQLKLLDNTIKTAELALDTARNRLTNSNGTLTADFAGVITDVNGTPNTIATIQSPVVTLKDDTQVYVALNLGKSDAVKAKVGQAAIIKYNSTNYEGTLSFLNPAATSSISGISGSLAGAAAGAGDVTLGAKVDVNNPAGMILDFEADVEILVDRRAGVITVPIEALSYRKAGEAYVFVIEEGVAAERKVEVGLVSDTVVQIVTGLVENETVILNPPADLVTGKKVVLQ